MAKTSQPKKNKRRLTKAELAKEIEAKPGSFSGLSVDAFLLLDENLNLMSINDAGQKMFGVSKAGVFGKCILDVIPDIKNTGIYKKYRHVLKTGKSIVAHLELGGRHLSVQLFKQGDALGMIAADITERKKMEEALQESEKRFRLLYERAPFGYQSLNEDGYFIEVNQAWLDLLGFSREEVIGRWFGDFFAPGYQEHFKKNFSRFKAAGEIHGVEYEMPRKDGSMVTVAFDGRIGYDEHGKFKQTHCILQNITERKKAEEALRRSEEYFRALIENAQDAIVILNDDGTIRYESLPIERLWGYKVEDWIGKNFSEFVSPDDMQNAAEMFAKLLQNPSFLLHTEMRVRHKNGSIHVVEASGQNLLGNPAVNGIVLNVCDITERKKMEEKLSRIDRALRVTSSSNVTLVRATEELEYLREVCRIAVEVGGYRLAWVGFAEQDAKKTVRPVAYAGYEKGYLEKLNITWADTERGRGPTGTAIRGGVPSVARYILTDPNFEPWRAEALKRGYASSIALPLRSDGVPLGALNIYAAEPDAFDEGELGVLKEMANDLAYGIIVLRLRAERKRAEEALRESEVRLRELFENMSSGVAVYEAINEGQDFIFKDFNKAGERIEKIERRDVIGKSVLDVFPWVKDFGLFDVFRRVWSTGNPERHPISLYEDERIVGWRENYVYKLPSGEIVAIYDDVTERKKAEEELRKSIQLLNDTGEMAKVGGWELDLATKEVSWTEEVARIHGVGPRYKMSLEEAINFYAPESIPVLKETLKKTAETGEPYDLESLFIPSGSKDKIWVRSLGRAIYSGGKIVKLAGTFQNIDKYKRAEERLQSSLKEKEALLSEVHHRVKNNFQLISSLLDMVGMRARNEETISLCASVHARVHAMGLIHSQLYQSGSFAQIDMEAHVKELVGYLAQVYATNGIKITPAIDASGVYLSITPAVPCALALNEVISNAFKHAFQGRQKGTIEISLRKSAEGMVTMRVKDDGIGMPEDFDIDKTSTLGLKLTRNLVREQLKGSIQFKRGNGTEVTIEFKVG